MRSPYVALKAAVLPVAQPAGAREVGANQVVTAETAGEPHLRCKAASTIGGSG